MDVNYSFFVYGIHVPKCDKIRKLKLFSISQIFINITVKDLFYLLLFKSANIYTYFEAFLNYILLSNFENYQMYFFFVFIACKVGWFDNCSQQCIGHCRYNSNCNNVTGRCDKGCAAGWTGTFCDEGKFLLF